jgi:Mn2+/Fe2+ NRAMP family transporter
MKAFLARLGPGLLYAGAAVGVSHLVQSTRAGANYGLIMILVVIAANIIKYPFFKAGPLFAAANKKSLIEAFYERGKWAMSLFYAITISGMFTVQAVVTLLTASVFSSLFHISIPLWQVSGLLLLVCSAVLLAGSYKSLDNIMKTVIVLLAVTTLITVIAAFISDTNSQGVLTGFSFNNQEDLFFLIALIGWMPAPLDIALWHSEWTMDAAREKGEPLSVQKSVFDFNIGYWGTTALAAAFVALGALLLGKSGTELPASGVAFSGQLIDMYVSTLGKWSFGFVALAAFTTMFSTTLTVLDAYPRVLQKAIQLNFPKWKRKLYPMLLLILVVGALFVLVFQLDNMKQLVDFATTVSFVTAPILASLIYFVVQKNTTQLFSNLEKYIAWFGLVFLYAFSLYYIWAKWI